MSDVDARVLFAADAPALRGHFPGSPIVPGALLLSEIAEIVAREWGRPVCGVRNAKFRRPLLPDRQYDVHLSSRADGDIEFACTDADGILVNGVLIAAEGT